MTRRRPDVYFTPEYVAADACRDGVRWISIDRFDGLFQMPLLLHPLTGECVDASSPYGYSGVYGHPDLPVSEMERAWPSVVEELRDLRVVSVFLRHSPLVPQAPIGMPHTPVVRDHPTVAIRTSDSSRAWAELTGRCRTTIRKAQASGARVEMRPAAYDDLRRDGDFRRLYEQTMARNNAGDFYYFPDEYYKLLREGLGERLLLARGLDAHDRVQSAALFIRHENLLHYHLSGSSLEGRKLGLNNLVIWTAVERAEALKVHTLHLGGATRNGSLMTFKASFAPHRLSYSATGLIIDPATYAALSRRRPHAADPSFFPRYRSSGGN